MCRCLLLKGDSFGDALSFNDRDDRVCLNLSEGLRASAGPPYLQAIDSTRHSQAEVDASIVLAQIAGAGFDLAQLGARSHGHEQSGADGVMVARLPDQTNLQRVL